MTFQVNEDMYQRALSLEYNQKGDVNLTHPICYRLRELTDSLPARETFYPIRLEKNHTKFSAKILYHISA